MHQLMLDGIEGHNLWGFLTALGTLSLLTDHARSEGLVAPRLAFDAGGKAVVQSWASRDQLAAVLLGGLRKLQPYLVQDLADVKKPSDFSRSKFECLAAASARAALDFLAGLACVVADEAFESTLCAANGASHQCLVQSMRDVLDLVEEEHIRIAIFEEWRHEYAVPGDKRRQFDLGTRKPTLRLDPADERLYALRLSNPTTADDFTTELGAQALAIPAFALLPVVPAKRPVTVASTRDRQRVSFEWALWDVPATLHTARSFAWQGAGEPQERRKRGAFAGFSVDRVAGAKGKLSFAPTQGVW